MSFGVHSDKNSASDIRFILQHFKYLDFMQVTVRDKLIQKEFIYMIKDYYCNSIYRNTDCLA